MKSFVLCHCLTFHYKIPAWCITPKVFSLSTVLVWKVCTFSQKLVPPARGLDVVEALFFSPRWQSWERRNRIDMFLVEKHRRGVGWEVLAHGICPAIAVQCSGRLPAAWCSVEGWRDKEVASILLFRNMGQVAFLMGMAPLPCCSECFSCGDYYLKS